MARASSSRRKGLRSSSQRSAVSGAACGKPDTADRWELLRKPFRREELARAMARALRREA